MGVMLIVMLFAFCWSGLVLLADCTIGRDYYKQYESGKFPSVTGTITHSELQTHTNSKGDVYYTVIIDYVYKVGGQTFTGDRLAFSEDEPGISEPTIVNSHPAGSAVQVYYNPRDPNESLLYPGVTAGDSSWVLFLTPFNSVMIGFWTWIGGWLRLRLFKPIAGGVRIIEDGTTTRVRLPRWDAIWWALATTAGLGFIFTILVGAAMNMHPLTTFVLPITGLIYFSGLGVYVWRCVRANSGDEDLVINEASGTLELPLTFGRKERMTVGFRDIKAIWVETIVNSGPKGTSYVFAPTLKMRSDSRKQRLAGWSDQMKAVDFTVWLGEKTGAIPIRNVC